MGEVRSLFWERGRLYLLDQNRLPEKVEYRACTTCVEVAAAISDMTVRGAPAIGVAAAFGVVLEARERCASGQDLAQGLEGALSVLASTRPTAVNLFWALQRMRRRWAREQGRDPAAIADALEEEAQAIYQEDVANNRQLAKWGSSLVPAGSSVLTHCNAGALATVGFGTALGVIRAAHEAGKIRMVYADETRPRLQGARLTSWELVTSGIPVTVVCDNMAAYLMAAGQVDLVIVGADRIAANGDVANKIGTYGLAVAAWHHGIPFYVAAPTSTVDLDIESGEDIPIEERPEDEVRLWGGREIVPQEAKVFNPAFDVTPASLITALVTERGILRHPLESSLQSLRG